MNRYLIILVVVFALPALISGAEKEADAEKKNIPEAPDKSEKKNAANTEKKPTAPPEAPVKTTTFVTTRRVKKVPDPRKATTNREIAGRLSSRRVSVEYVESELGDVIRDIARLAGVNIIVDNTVDRKKLVNLKVTDMSVGKALDWVMELTAYHTQIKNEAVLISKNKDSQMVTRIYPITDLITPAKSTYPPGQKEDEEDEDEGPSKEERAEKLLEVIKKVVGKELGN